MGKKMKNLQQSKDPNKPKKAKTITLKTFIRELAVKNNNKYQVINALLNAANQGKTEYTGKIANELYARLTITRKDSQRGIIKKALEGKQISEATKTEGIYTLSWKHAFREDDKIDLTCFSPELSNQELIQQIEDNLLEFLYISTYKARKDKVETAERAPREVKGKILIVEDKIEEKINDKFLKLLYDSGYDAIYVENLEQATAILEDESIVDSLDGIILDFKIPVSEEDRSLTIHDRPCGIELFDKKILKYRNKRIPVILNTTADNDLKVKYLKSIGIDIDERNIGLLPQSFLQSISMMPIYNTNGDLLDPKSTTMKEILDLFKERTERRKTEKKIEADNRWWQKNGGPFLRDSKGNIIGYK